MCSTHRGASIPAPVGLTRSRFPPVALALSRAQAPPARRTTAIGRTPVAGGLCNRSTGRLRRCPGQPTQISPWRAAPKARRSPRILPSRSSLGRLVRARKRPRPQLSRPWAQFRPHRAVPLWPTWRLQCISRWAAHRASMRCSPPWRIRRSRTWTTPTPTELTVTTPPPGSPPHPAPPLKVKSQSVVLCLG